MLITINTHCKNLAHVYNLKTVLILTTMPAIHVTPMSECQRSSLPSRMNITSRMHRNWLTNSNKILKVAYIYIICIRCSFSSHNCGI